MAEKPPHSAASSDVYSCPYCPHCRARFCPFCPHCSQKSEGVKTDDKQELRTDLHRSRKDKEEKEKEMKEPKGKKDESKCGSCDHSKQRDVAEKREDEKPRDNSKSGESGSDQNRRKRHSKHRKAAGKHKEKSNSSEEGKSQESKEDEEKKKKHEEQSKEKEDRSKGKSQEKEDRAKEKSKEPKHESKEKPKEESETRKKDKGHRHVRHLRHRKGPRKHEKPKQEEEEKQKQETEEKKSKEEQKAEDKKKEESKESKEKHKDRSEQKEEEKKKSEEEQKPEVKKADEKKESKEKPKDESKKPSKKSEPEGDTPVEPAEPVKRETKTTFIVVCHGETVDEVFPNWVRVAFSGGNSYQAFDLNMRSTIPRRPIKDYRYDPPLTQHGAAISEYIGLGIGIAGYEPYVIYSSPELRCVETASGIAHAAGIGKNSICLEPSLADWVQTSPGGGNKKWISAKQHLELGHPINESYKPFLEKLPDVESPKDYLRRLCKFFLAITESPEKVLIIVANAHALEVAMNRPWSTAKEIIDIKRSIRNCDIREIDITTDLRVVAGPPKVLPFTKALLCSQQAN